LLPASQLPDTSRTDVTLMALAAAPIDEPALPYVLPLPVLPVPLVPAVEPVPVPAVEPVVEPVEPEPVALAPVALEPVEPAPELELDD
jgi:hypothetical protein